MLNSLTKPRHQFMLASVWLLAWSIVLVLIGAQINKHGLVRTIAGDTSISRVQVWPWTYVDEADFDARDFPHVVNQVDFRGVVWQGRPGQTIWHVIHTGGLVIRVDGQTVLDAKERGSPTTDDIPVTWEEDHLDLEIEFVGGPEAWDYNSPTMRMGIYEHAPWGGWRLIPAHRLYAETPKAETAKMAIMTMTIGDIARGAWFAGVVVVVVLGMWHFRPWQRTAFWIVGGIALLAALTRYISLVQQEASSPFFYYYAPGSDNYVLLGRELLAGNVGFAATSYFVPGNLYWLAWWTLLVGPHQRVLVFVNILLAVLSVCALAGVTWRTIGRQAGFFCGLIAATFPLMVGYQTNLTVASPLISFTALAVAAGVWIEQRPTWQSSTWFGLANGCAGLLKPTALFVGPALVLAQVITRNAANAWRGWRQAITISVIAAICSLMVIGPQIAANVAAGADVIQGVQVGSSGALVMYMGANREASGQNEHYRPAYLRVQHSDRDWNKALSADLKAYPGRALELYLHKLGLVWSNLEYGWHPNNTSLDVQVGRVNGGELPQYPWFGMSSLAFLGITGVSLVIFDRASRRSSALWFLLWSIVFLMLVIAAFPVISRYRVPMYPPLCVAAGAGIQAAIKTASKKFSIRTLLIAMAMAGMALLAAFCFEEWLPRKIYLEDLPAEVVERNVVFENQLRLLGFMPLETDHKSHGYLYGTFYWQLLNPTSDDLMVSVQLLDRDGERVAWADAPLGSRSYPEVGTSRWPAGAKLAESFFIELPDDAPSVMDVYVNLYHPDSEERLLILSPDGTLTDTDRMWLGRLGLLTEDAMPSLEDPITEVNYQLGHALLITGFSLPQTISQSNDLTVGVQLEATEQLYDDYVLFFHLLNEDGQVVAQSDSPVLSGDWTTAALIPGYSLGSARLIDLPDEMPPGTYRLRMGMYSYPSLERLPAWDAQGNMLPDNLIDVGKVKIK